VTRDEAQELIQRLVGTSNPMALHEFEFGWLAQEDLSQRERSTGMQVGLGSYIIDRDGTVTVHGSLPVPVTLSRYVAERRQGRIPGRQVWPVTESQPE
jgi:hypothetical protein